MGHSKDRTREHVSQPSSHVVLPKTVPQTAGQYPTMATPHRPKVDEPQHFVIVGFRDPAFHAALVTVDSVPHHFANETTDFLEAFRAIQLCHSNGHLIAAPLRNQLTRKCLRCIRWTGKIGLAAAGSYPRIRVHPMNENLEIAGRKVEIEVEFANVGEITRVDRLISLVESIDHARPYLT